MAWQQASLLLKQPIFGFGALATRAVTVAARLRKGVKFRALLTTKHHIPEFLRSASHQGPQYFDLID
jgi:hypothetical protein